MELPVISFNADRTEIIEGGEAQLLSFNLSEPAPAGGLTVNINIDDPDGESADTEFPPELISNIVDFGQTEEDGIITASLTIAEGETSATFGISAIADELEEGNETYSLTLLEDETYIAERNSTTITTVIKESSIFPTVSITPEILIVTEGETLAWNISLDRPAPEGGLSLSLLITDNNDPAPGDINYFLEGSSNITEFEFVTSNESISQIYAFGDSYSDEGLSFEISTDAVEAGILDSFILPADPELGLYDPQGRWTNGETAVEVLADNLGVDLTNYAVGGAKSGDGNYYSWLDSFQNTGLLGQIEQFNSDLAGQKADPNAMYFIFASANDFFEYADFSLPGTIEELAAQTVDNLKKSITKLAESGAKKFFVVNSSDLGILPGTIEFNQAEDAALFTEEVNKLLIQELPALESELSIDLILYNHEAISDEIFANPEEYGLTNIVSPYQPVFPVELPTGNPNEYYFWDEYHPTSRTHEIIGEDMVDFVDFDDGEVSTGFNITIAEGETEATLVSEVVIDGVEEGEESFTTVLLEGDDYNVNFERDRVVTNLVDADTTTNTPSPVFGTTKADTIEVNGGGKLVFAGDSDDLIDASLSDGGNRIYGGNSDDIFVLGENDRIFGGEGDDQFFATSGGNNTITGGSGADQFWIVTASIPESANIITDFTLGEDVIGIAGLGIGFDDLTITQTDADTLITASGSDLAVLTSVSADSLTSDNFALS